jgi:hypothetical protein
MTRFVGVIFFVGWFCLRSWLAGKVARVRNLIKPTARLRVEGGIDFQIGRSGVFCLSGQVGAEDRAWVTQRLGCFDFGVLSLCLSSLKRCAV